MGLTRNRAFACQLALLAGALAVFAAAAAAVEGSRAGLWVLAAGALACALFATFSLRRYRQIARLASEVDEVLHGGRRIAFSDYREGDLAVLGADLRPLAERYALKARTVFVDATERFPHSRLMGRHNRINEEAAWQACRLFGVREESAARAVARFAPLPHRLERVRELRGVLYVNDSKCTTVSALQVALEAFDRPVRLLCGGKFKGGDLAALSALVREKVKEVVLFGASREHFEKAWQGVVPLSWHPTLEPAVRFASADAQPGEVVLLAPATSSYDLYRNYEERGDDFKRLVGLLA